MDTFATDTYLSEFDRIIKDWHDNKLRQCNENSREFRLSESTKSFYTKILNSGAIIGWLQDKLPRDTIIDTIEYIDNEVHKGNGSGRVKQMLYPHFELIDLNEFRDPQFKLFFDENNLVDKVNITKLAKEVDLRNHQFADIVIIISEVSEPYELLLPEGVKVRYCGHEVSSFHESFKNIHFIEVLTIKPCESITTLYGLIRTKLNIGNPCVDTFERQKVILTDAKCLLDIPKVYRYGSCLYRYCEKIDELSYNGFGFSSKRRLLKHNDLGTITALGFVSDFSWINTEIFPNLEWFKYRSIERYGLTRLTQLPEVNNYTISTQSRVLDKLTIDRPTDNLEICYNNYMRSNIQNITSVLNKIDLQIVPRQSITVFSYKVTFKHKSDMTKSAKSVHKR